jgi:hypothetical protein
MQIIKPLIPMLLQSIKQKKINTQKPAVKKISPAEQVVQGGKEVEITKETTAGELQKYIEAIRRGEISYEQALEDFKNSPYKEKLTDEQFKEKFDKIKEG